jgi:hypothetical protein
MEIIIFIISCFGASFIIINGSIFNTPREWITKRSSFANGLLSCIVCTGTWVGFFTSFMLGSLSLKYFPTYPVINIFYDGMISAAGCYILDSIVDRINK